MVLWPLAQNLPSETSINKTVKKKKKTSLELEKDLEII